jgi:hypothetical protein
VASIAAACSANRLAEKRGASAIDAPVTSADIVE